MDDCTLPCNFDALQRRVEARTRLSGIPCPEGRGEQLLGLRDVRQSSPETILPLEPGQIDRLLGTIIPLLFMRLHCNMINRMESEKKPSYV